MSMCFDAVGGEGLAYFTFAVETAALLSSQMKEPPPLEKLASVEGDKTCAYMGWGALGPQIPLAGDASPGQPSFVPYTRMLSAKAEPFMAEIDGLSDPPFITGRLPARPGITEFSYLTLTSYKEIFLSSPAFGVLRYNIDRNFWYSDIAFGRPLLPFVDKSGVSFNFGDEDGQKMCLVTIIEDPDLDEIDVVVATCEFSGSRTLQLLKAN
ncbi:Uncharacterized protein TCM_026978 [Theobroma cacao]|uniref:Uncharacterized protein n=1 Tax=Theobroma cacao TaxID=3641 RepID=A0A061G7P9_THECC|nr:Uncharacterized protein TCM_026978 [Theobroma cacao]